MIKVRYLFLLLALSMSAAHAAPPSYGYTPQPVQRQGGGEDLTTVLRQLRTGLSDVQHELSVQQSELSLSEKKIQDFEQTLDHIRSELTSDAQAERDFVRAASVNTDGKIEVLDHAIKNIEGMIKNLTADLKLMKTQANDTATALGQYKLKFSEIETLLQTQSQHMHNLETAMQSMMEVWQAKEAARNVSSGASAIVQSTDGLRSYVVQPGDSLGKIAQSQHVTVQGLREANQLSNDRIFPGQTLKLPAQ